ncbi:hypothetical protein R6Q57_021888 [Mikania cordata]
MGEDHPGKKDIASQRNNHGFEQILFSWTLDDIMNEHLYQNKVENIPLTFQSKKHYFGSFVYLLLEETRYELASSIEIMYRAPYAEVFSVNETKKNAKLLYDITVGNWRNRFSERGKEPYWTIPGDVLIVTNGKPESVSDLQRVGRTCGFLVVNSISGDGGLFRAKASQQIEFQKGMFVVFLMNITTNKRIWDSLHMKKNMNIIKEVLDTNSMVKVECCNICRFDNKYSPRFDPHLLDKLNESQAEAIRAALRKMECCHRSFVQQIWGPPGTGKKTTICVLLFILLQKNRRTLTCAPTNVAVVQLASRVLHLIRESSNTRTTSGDVFYCVGDVVLLFGKKQMLKDKEEIEEIYLENRIKRLTECLEPFIGWKHCVRSMIDLLENCVSQYHVFLKNELYREEQFAAENQNGNKTSKLELQNDSDKLGDMSSINVVRAKTLSVLKTLQISLEGLDFPRVLSVSAITDFCIQNASLIFSTTSTSYKLHFVEMKPLEILVIDEAAQLKEAESTIPFQLPGMKHAVLIGDECQLPAVVSSNILDAENVTYKSYEKQYLSGTMFGSYSFINIIDGREEKDEDERSRRNLVEVAVVIKIVQNLHKAWQNSGKKIAIGVVSPYAAQVVSIQEKLANKYEELDGFSVKVKSVDGFQGAEEDVIILSTVRSNRHGSVGFLSSPQRTNVALTRARHCLWILGNEKTLSNSEYIWKELVCDARNRHCLFDADADADECLKTTILDAKQELNQLDDLVNGNSVLFKHEKWKVLFCDDFKRSFGKVTSTHLKKLVLNVLLKLSSGWRSKNKMVDMCCEKSSQVLKKIKVEGLYIICSIDIIKEVKYAQVLKFWDILPLDEIPKLTKRLESIFSTYTDDYINCCRLKTMEGNLEVPSTWSASHEIIRFRSLRNREGDNELIVKPGDGSISVENSRVSESFLLMKFYSLSCGAVSHLNSSKELDLPMQVTDEQMDIILFPKTSFIIGRSGTGKTRILTSKLVQNEKNFLVTCEGINEAKSTQISDAEVDFECSKPSVLRQLFVTVSPKLCYAVKQHISHLTSVSFHGNSSARIGLEDADPTLDFSDIPDTFVEIPVKKYPLVITFHKFLMMLNGTLGNSYFERFREAREGSHGSSFSSRSVALQTFIRLKEVTFDRFCSLYWPHFNSKYKKKLDPSQVFSEIISHIKGGLETSDHSDGKLSFESYSLLAESRSSTLTKQNRENVYSLFQAYENMKTKRGEFDLGDLVIDLHQRLQNLKYEGDQMDFIFIDEVQDLSMRQISLFKYVCQNVFEGFVFAGDTAQTIAKGIDFRFQDITSLFYKEFLTPKTAGKQEKGLISKIFQLKQNFRTHAGVLDLAQSVIDILYRYFSHSIDILEPETSLIYGEAPILLEAGNNENAIVTIFGGRESDTGIVGFGAEQVILVRDDGAKSEICEYIGKKALVLTVMECKGLEFQDVLLYNIFGTSPLKDQWRVIYGYMKEHNWLDGKLPQSFPCFSESRHSVLCSELKQLYVAITRTRQRLWICEKNGELSKPMFDYWKRKGLIQTRKLDYSVVQAMRVASGPQEWKERGKKVEKIPLTFKSQAHYVGSFVHPLLEETRAELASAMEIMYRAPNAEIFSINEAKGREKMLYDITVSNWRNIFSERGKEPYKTLPGDLLILADGKPESVSDLQRMGRFLAFLLVRSITEDEEEYDMDSTSSSFKVKASQEIEFQDGMFVVFLTNITTNKRIWNSLHMHKNMSIIKDVLYTDSMVKECCDICLSEDKYSQNFDSRLLDQLNESQAGAIRAALCKTECCHGSFVEQIWGPPGTGKTTTVSVLLFILLKMNRRTLTCAPTNVAIVQVASRVLNLVKESSNTTTASGHVFYCIGDVLLFGNKQRLKVDTEIEEIYLENRVKRLTECLGSLTGWKHCIRSMIDLLEDCVSLYNVFVENELYKENQLAAENQNENIATKLEVKSFIEYVRDRFGSCVMPLKRCILTFLTHIPKSFIRENNFQKMILLLDDLSFFNSLLFEESLVSQELEQLFTPKLLQTDYEKLGDMLSIGFVRAKILSVLKTLQISLEELRLPSVLNRYAIMDFCFQNASLIFCTTSTSYKLHTVEMKPLEILVIDEAAQLKEAESTIPLQLLGMKHAILIGDECQLPAMVSSNVCIESGFGRSLFGRLSSLGHSKHLLNVQYRMHPSISLFPNYKFYQNQILDAENVTCKSYEKQYLSGPMFGSYSFINIVGGREEKDEDERSGRNMVEVAIVIKIVQNLYKAWQESRKKLTVGVVSPYAAQVVSIQEKFAKKYEKLDGFSVKVKSIDGFQGGEEDIIILSTVRSNSNGSVGFLSSPERTNVALTRARHCLWILGNERTLGKSECVWKELVCDARNRSCLFDADVDECLRTTILDTKKALDELDDLVNGSSVLFKHAKWKVLFSDDFRRSFGKLTSTRLKTLVLNLLLKLSGGWRPKNKSVDLCCGKISQILKKFKVDSLYIVCSVDIIKDVKYIQVLKVWDILPLEEIPKLTKRLESIFSAFTDDYINRCTAKCLEGNLEVPRSWLSTQELIRFRTLSNCEGDNEAIVNPSDGRIYVENSKVSESLLLMKFYSLSHGVVSHLLSGKDFDLPMQVTDEQMDIILFPKSSFIIGRSGTGKTTILTSKLFQNEQIFRDASEGSHEAESSEIRDVEVDSPENRKRSVLRQLFVTVSPKLCYAVKQHVSQLTSISCHGNSPAEINLDVVDSASAFNDIPDTFVDIPVKKFPLVITFQKFLMMLDGTLGCSYFERFHEAREGSHGNHVISGSVALQTIIREKEVTFDRFCSHYWSHFNSNYKKRLDPSRVFTEIISHIKGGQQAGDCSDGKLSFEDYTLLAESRASTLTKQKRENVYCLFQAYESMKTERGEFDLGDLVIDLHHRLRYERYEGDQIDFIYIDEVQDLSMRQISLFKYICQNVNDGFVFAGDTAQTIARGIDFRFQDIRSLFYKEFLTSRTAEKQEKGLVSEIFQLKQNFRTHVGVLDLAQSVIDILYCYFSYSIDILEPETSLISGEAPVLLESGNDENAIVTIFGGSGSGAEIVDFGAEQVILVRDEAAKSEICEYIGKQALVLTIVECKGLEFQDVLLYNFFGTSPLKDQWRVIYGYMKERDWLDEKLIPSFPSFSESRHSVLCSELKQLYVAITRTRQRLWMCENKEELSKPMFDYWKRRGLVQVRKLDASVAQAMRVASTPQEWRERGKKLLFENNFVMATMCFERSGDINLETLAKASGLRASADQMRGTNLEAFKGYVGEAAGMFESIGKFEFAASCYCDLGEFERAGKLNLKCGRMDAAAECFTLAGSYIDAAEAYAKGDKLSECLSVCRKGKLFDKGLQYIEQWKEHGNVQSKEIELIDQQFLESCALDHHDNKDCKSMMKFVHAFCSMESKRAFLRSLGCLDDLLILEEESGYFLDAAELARSWGDVLKEADLLEKAGQFKEAVVLLLWYVFFSSLWEDGNKGWPLKQFAHKEELCVKVKLLAKTHSDSLYESVCGELDLLSAQHSSLFKLQKDLHISQKNESLHGEIFLRRKILDFHICLNSSKYHWEDKLPIDIHKHCEELICLNQVSVRTLVLYWNAWKENVLDIFESLERFHKEEPNQHEGHVDFILNFFGVRKQTVKGNIVYMLVNEHADWIRNAGKNGLRRDGKLLTIDIRDLVFSVRSYWQSELHSVGLKVLETLENLYKSKLNGPAFHQSTSLLHIFEVSKFFLDCQQVKLKDTKMLGRYLRISLTYFDLVFPLDWRRSVSDDLISLRETDLSLNLLEEIINQHLNIKGDFNYWTIGRVMMICLGSRKPAALYKRIITRIQFDPVWKSFFEIFMNGGFKDAYAAQALHNALEDTFRANWKRAGYISLHSFVYLLESLLFMACFSLKMFFTTKSSFVGRFTHIHSTSTYSAPKQIQDNAIQFIVRMIQHVLHNKTDTISWIRSSNINFSFYHPLLSLKLVMMLSLICLQVSDYSQVLFDLLLGGNNIACFLPRKFVYDLLRRRKGRYLNLNPDVVAEAFMSIDDPLLIVRSGNANPRIHAPCAIFVDLGISKEEIVSLLFPRKPVHSVEIPSNSDDIGKILETPSSSMLPDENLNVNPVEPQMNWKVLDVISETIKGKEGVELHTLSVAATIKKELDKNIDTLATTLMNKLLCAGKDATVLDLAIDELKMLSSEFGTSSENVDPSVKITSDVQGVVERLQSVRPKIDDFFNRSATGQESKIEQMVISESNNAIEVEETSEEKDHVKETGDGLVVVGNQSDDVNTQDTKNKKGKGKKDEKNKGSKTFEVEQTSEEKNHVKDTGDSLVVVGNQSGGVNTQDAKNKKGKGKKKKNKGKKK